MDFRKLSAFCKVYEHRSFSRAGEALYLSQPTISAHVHSLEEELGVSLFDRLGRTVLPTGPAEVLYRAASEVFRRLEVARGEIDLIQEKVSGTVAIGASTIPAHWLLPDLLAGFSQTHPEVRFSLSVSGSGRILRELESGTLEIGMVGAAPRDEGLTAVPLVRDEIVAVVRRDARDRLVGQEPMERWPWIMREPGCGTRQALELGFSEAGRSLASLGGRVLVESTHAVIASVRAGLGVGAVSRLAVERELAEGDFVAVDLGLAPIRRSIHLVHKTGRTLLPATVALAAYVERELAGRG